MRRTLTLTLGLLLPLATNACKTANVAGSTSVVKEAGESTGASCSCSDLACWQSKSNEAAVKQLECAKDAVTAAATLSTGGLATAVIIGSNLIDIGHALSDENVAALFAGSADAGANVLKAFGTEGKPLVECVDSSFETVANVAAIIDTMRDYDPKNAEGLTDVVTAISHGSEATHRFASVMLDCLNSVKVINDNPAITDFKKFIEAWSNILNNINAAVAVVNCGAKITAGGMVLIQNTQCLAQDLKNLEDSRVAVTRALAFDGSRAFNNARLTGCGCINTHWWQSAQTELENCKSCCDGSVGAVMPATEPHKRNLWTVQCQLSCNIAFTNGTFVDYMDTRNCDEVRRKAQTDPTWALYRDIDLLDKNSSVPAKQQAETERAQLLDALQQLKDNFGQVDNACPGQEPASGFLTRGKLACCAQKAQGPLKDACTLFGVSYAGSNAVPYYWGLLDTADSEAADNRVGVPAINAFTQEVTLYQDESEAR